MDIDKDNQFFNKDLVNLVLKAIQSIKKIKRHNLIFKIAISGIKSFFSTHYILEFLFNNKHYKGFAR